MIVSRSDGSSVIAALSLLLVPTALAPVAAAGPPATTTRPQTSITRDYDLRPMHSRGAPPLPGVTMDLHLSTAAIDNLEPPGYDINLGDEVDWTAKAAAGAVRAALRSLGVDSAASEGAKVSVDGRWLRVTGSEAAQREATRAIAQIEKLMLDTYAIEVLEVPRGAVANDVGAQPATQQADAILAQAGVRTLAHLSVPIGRTKTLDQTTIRSFLWDYDIEVAQGSVVADPAVSILRTGTELGLRLDHAADGNSFILRVWGRHGEELKPWRSVPIPVLGGAEIELPVVRSSILASSARLLAGESLLVDVGGPSLLALRLGSSKSDRGQAAPSLGEHVLAPMQPDLVPLPWNEPSQGWGIDRDAVAKFDERGLSGMAGAPALLRSAKLEDVPMLGTQLLCSPDSTQGEAASRLIQALNEARPVPEFEVEVRYSIQSKDAAAGPAAADDVQRVEAHRVEAVLKAENAVRLASSTVGADATLLVHGVEAAYLQDFDSQIAAGSVGPDPITKTRFVGASVWCSPIQTSSGALRAWFDVRVHSEGDATRRYEGVSYHPLPGSGDEGKARFIGEMKLDLPIELPMTHTAGGALLCSLEDGQWAHVLTQELGSTGQQLVVIARIQAR